jgi:hypothetical protein
MKNMYVAFGFCFAFIMFCSWGLGQFLAHSNFPWFVDLLLCMFNCFFMGYVIGRIAQFFAKQ